MAYLALQFDAEASCADAWVDALLAAGALSVDMADPHAESSAETPLFGEPGAAPSQAWPVSRLTALFPEGVPGPATVDQLQALMGVALPPHAFFAVPEQDWVRATQAQFQPFAITDALWIVPSWASPVDPGAINLVLDPGLAFGTGSHATTRLCLRWLATALRPAESVLDYGCGSGILAIAAARLGATGVVATDLDPQAIMTSRSNAMRNGVDVRVVTPDVLAAEVQRFDVVLANILANPLVLLAPALARRVRSAGRIVLSGVLAPQADEVAAAYGEWFRIAVWREEDGWVALEGERRPDDRPGPPAP